MNFKKDRIKKYEEPRNSLAYVILIFSATAITGISITAIVVNNAHTMTVFNIILPVFASWVGTILAFYFGRDNFESANAKVQEMVSHFLPSVGNSISVNTIMKQLNELIYFEIEKNEEGSVEISELIQICDKDGINRLPILDLEKKPIYMIHRSSFDKYIASEGGLDDSLSQFLKRKKAEGTEFGPNKGFILVSKNTDLVSANDKLRNIKHCKDIFVTKNGLIEESLKGWISERRLANFLNPQ